MTSTGIGCPQASGSDSIGEASVLKADLGRSRTMSFSPHAAPSDISFKGLLGAYAR